MARGLVVLVAFLALQATCNAALSLSPQALVQQFTDKVNALRQQIESTIANVEDNVVNNTDALVTKIHNDIQQISENVRTEVEAVVAKFKAAGEAAVECTEKIPSIVDGVIANVTKSAADCIATQVKDGESLISDVINAGNQINDTVTNVQKQLADCQKNILTAPACIISVITSATATISSDSARISIDITKAAALVTGFQMNVNSCETNVFQSIPSRVQEGVSTAAGCYTSS